jgi:hypothetical protein
MISTISSTTPGMKIRDLTGNTDGRNSISSMKKVIRGDEFPMVDQILVQVV